MDRVGKFDWRLTFVLDAVLLVLQLVRGTHWFAAVLVAEAIMWLVRLIWISPLMLRFILRRLAQMIPIVLAVILIGFILLDMAPGDPFTAMELNPNVRREDIANLRRQFGFGQPPYVQFFYYLWNALQGNFGFSTLFRAPVFTLVGQYALNTVLLSMTALAFSWVLSIPFGIIAATKQYKWQDQTIGLLAFFGLAIPNFFLAFLLQFLIVKLSPSGNLLLPIAGMTSLDHNLMGPLGKFFDVLRHMVLPVFVIGTSGMASLTRIMRANMLDVMGMQYITTARAKGLNERVVIYVHALRNAINPMVTILGFEIASVMSGAALTEIVLSWPGLGNLILSAITAQDMFLVIGSLLYSSVLLVVGNLLADILLALVDPRVRIA